VEARRRGIRIDPSDLLLEIVSIVIAILLALAVNRWQEGLAHNRTLHESLLNVRQEIVSNRATLEKTVPLHQRVATAFLTFVSKRPEGAPLTFAQVFQLFHRTAPLGFQPVHGDDIAWQIAQSTQAVSYMPYETRAALTRVYDEQTALYSAQQRFVDTAFSPSAPSNDYYPAAFAAALWLGDVANDESELLRRYETALKLLPTS